MATKTKSTAKKSSARKPAARKRSAPKKSAKVSFESEGFGPIPADTKVAIHKAANVSVERASDREPFEDPIQTVTTDKQGGFKVSGLKKGEYVVVAPVGRDVYRYVAFSVKD